MSRVLIAGESWINASTDYKGYDAFPHTQLEVGAAPLLEALSLAGHEPVHLASHAVATDFPATLEELANYDVVILSDIGANSLLLPPQVFTHARPFPNRLKLLSEWVRRGGGLAMAGGYLSFQGFEGKANYHATPIEDVLPVDIHPYDDRTEAPEGVYGELTGVEHPVTGGLEKHWPMLLGYQRLIAKPDSELLATIESHPLLVTRLVGAGRTLAFASDISPHWAPEEFTSWPGYGRLFGEAVAWLAGKA